MVEASFLAAFFGGVLSLLSPCSALLLPAFFAYAFQGGELVKRTGLFYLGLAATLVPLGMGISAVSTIFYGYRDVLIPAAGAMIIAFGVLQILGRGFTVGPIARMQGKIQGDTAGATFALGAVYGFAGFCSGPILGAVLTVAAASGQVLQGAGLLATYAAGMAAPLFLMALLWDRFDLGHRRWLRGREVSLGPVRAHTTSLISGLMFILLGAVFIIYQGTSAFEGFYDANGATDLAFTAQQWAGNVAESFPVISVILVVAFLAAAFFLYKNLRRDKKKPSEPQSRKGDPGESL
ncbi:MAG: cytochrome c biogenesis CcdA family protein [Rubrobacteraceae bacterium]